MVFRKLIAGRTGDRCAAWDMDMVDMATDGQDERDMRRGPGVGGQGSRQGWAGQVSRDERCGQWTLNFLFHRPVVPSQTTSLNLPT
jgi:hypothetical protein